MRHSDFEFDLYRRLNSNPKYLAFVRRIMDAKGGYVSPVVRDFLSFYTRCLNTKLNEYVKEAHVDPDILQKRLEGILGREKGRSDYFLNYYNLTILGCVHQEKLSADQADPDSTDYSFKVDPRTDTGAIVVKEIEDNLKRLLIRKFVEHTFNIHHNIRSIQYIDEAEQHQEKTTIRLISLERKLERYLQGLLSLVPQEAARKIRTHLIPISIGILIIAALVSVGILAAGLAKLLTSSPAVKF